MQMLTKVIDKINSNLSLVKDEGNGLFFGHLGINYFHFLYKILRKEALDDPVIEYNTICNNISQVEKIDSFLLFECSELGIFTNQLYNIRGIHHELIEIPRNIETLMESNLYLCARLSNYNMFMGALNFAYYFYTSYKTKNNKYYGLVLENFVNLLDEKISEEKCWTSRLSKYIKDNGYNFTNIHGVNSIIVFLNKLYLVGISKEKCKELVCKSICFELNYRRISGNNQHSIFPIGVYQNLKAIKGDVLLNNLNVGDLMIGYVILLSGKTFDKNEFINCSLDIIDSVKKESLVFNQKNIGVLEGRSGVSLLYKRIYELTKEKKYKYFASKLLYTEAEFFYSSNQTFDISLLTGISGLGTCLINYLLGENKINIESILL